MKTDIICFFQAIDLRWGLPDAGTSRCPFSVDLNLRHIAATQASSIGPNVAVSNPWVKQFHTNMWINVET